MADDSLSDGIERTYPVAAQIEVIYNITQKFRRQMIPEDLVISSTNDRKNIGGKATDSGTEELDTAWVAVFEGILDDGKNGSDELRWKLVDNRPALEFRTF